MACALTLEAARPSIVTYSTTASDWPCLTADSKGPGFTFGARINYDGYGRMALRHVRGRLPVSYGPDCTKPCLSGSPLHPTVTAFIVNLRAQAWHE